MSSNFPVSMADLNICHVNAQSLCAHYDEFKLFFEKDDYQIICISESWLKPSMPSYVVTLRAIYLEMIGRLGVGAGLPFT